MKRGELETALQDLSFRDILASAIIAFKSGKVDRVSLVLDGKAPMKQVAIELQTNEQITLVEPLLKMSLASVEKRLKAAGVEP